MPAMHNAETLEALRKIHPTGAAHQKHPKSPHMNSLQVTRATEEPSHKISSSWLLWWIRRIDAATHLGYDM